MSGGYYYPQPALYGPPRYIMRKEFRQPELDHRVPQLQREDDIRRRRSALPDDDEAPPILPPIRAPPTPGPRTPGPGYMARPMTVPPGYAPAGPPLPPLLLSGRQPAPLPAPRAPPTPIAVRAQTPGASSSSAQYTFRSRPEPAAQLYGCLVPGCGEQFAHPNFLDAHMRMHNCADKRCPCPYPGCGWRFDFPSDVRAHMMVHSGEKPYGCEYPGCGKRYQRQHDLLRHAKDKHGDDNPARRDRA